jgi:hypothetical protein
MKALYSAVISGKNKINVFNIEKGVRSYSIALGDVEIVNGPVVTHEKMTIIVKDRKGCMFGRVYTLPKGVVSYSFQIK